jgi:Flp pilus assembly protein TadB
MTPNSPESTVSGGQPRSVATSAASAVDQAQQAAGHVTEKAKQQATSQLESQKDRAIDSLVTVTQALRQTGQQLHEQEQGTIAGYVEQTAQRVEGLTNHLRARDVSQLLTDTEDLARRSPGMFLGAALAIGFIGARFLMSSGQRARVQRTPEAFAGAAGDWNGSGPDRSPYALAP